MGRAPCCEKTGLKKGPWTKDEDQLLINYIKENGHGNWRALPKKAGLLRCGKSCRLRWTNYLRPDIKRGNFTKEEEDAIIDLHKELGNKWSAIAGRLPGRTDNEIKNVWHTHLKKRLNPPPEPVKRVRKRSRPNPATKKDKSEGSVKLKGSERERGHAHTHETAETTPGQCGPEPEPPNSSAMQVDSPSGQQDEPNSPSQSSSEHSSITTATVNGGNASASSDLSLDAVEKFLEVDEDFWSDVISGDYSSITGDLPAVNSEPHFQPIQSTIDTYGFDPNMPDDMEFWYDIFTGDGEIQELLLL